MFIKDLKLRSFRSVGNAPLHLEFGNRITILIGPNNMGKSNILRALIMILETPFRPFTNKSIACREDDFHILGFAGTESNQSEKRTMSGNIQIQYYPNHADREMMIEILMDSLYLNLKHRLDNKARNEMKQKIGHVFDLYFRNPFSAIASLERTAENQPVLKRTFTGPSNLAPETIRQIDICMTGIGDFISGPHSGEKILHPLAENIFPRVDQIPQDVIPLDTSYKIPFEQLREKGLTLESIRDYLYMMKDDELTGKSTGKPYTALVRLMQTAFPDIDDIEAGMDPNTNKTRVLIVKRGQSSELGCQGDGLKKMLASLVYLTNSKADVILIDEPERYLHSKLETNLVEYMLKHTSGQIVLATHSRAMVNAIPGERMNNGDVIIYGISMDNQNCTLATRADESAIIGILENMGIAASRYDKHMAALASTLILIEGKSDKENIEKNLKKHGRFEEFLQCNPFFISLDGVHNLSRIPPDAFDKIAKGDDSLETPRVPFLILMDRDEERKTEKDHELILTVREMENVVISKEAIHGVACKYMKAIGVAEWDSRLQEFECALVEKIVAYLPKWALLIYQSKLINHLKPLLWRKSIGEPCWREAQEYVASILEALKAGVDDAENEYGVVQLEETHNWLRSKCFSEKGQIEYEFIGTEIPGKDFIDHILPGALVLAASRILEKNENTPDIPRPKLKSIAGAMSDFETLLAFSGTLHPDLEHLLMKLKNAYETVNLSKQRTME